MERAEFFATNLSPANQYFYDNLKPKEKEEEKKVELEEDGYGFLGFSLNELATLAKENAVALSECLRRVNEIVTTLSKSYMRKMKCTFEEVYFKLEETVHLAITKFDPSKGDFVHLLRRMIKLTISSYNKSLIIKRRKEIREFNEKLPQGTQGSIRFVNNKNDRDKIIFRMDIEDYVKYLSPEEKKILALYGSNYNFREIAEAVNLSPSYISLKIGRMVKELRNRMLGFGQ